MKFNEFKEKTLEGLKTVFPENTYIGLQDIKGNNRAEVTGLIIKVKDSPISPIIYMESYYRLYKEGMRFEEILENICQTWKENRQKTERWDILSLHDREKMKKRVMLKLVNYKENRELLERIPYRCFLDLAVVYYCIVDIDENGITTFLVDHHYSDILGMDELELYHCACENYLEQMPVKMKGLDDVIEELLGTEFVLEEAENEKKMYVISNERGFHGAAAMLFLNQYRNRSEIFGQDLYILPSSVHEILVLPVLTEEKEELEKIVREVNMTKVQREEKLADTVYRYYHKDGIVKIA